MKVVLVGFWCLVLSLVCVLLGAASVQAAGCEDPIGEECFGLHDVDVVFTGFKSGVVSQAGEHPFVMTISFRVNVMDDLVFKV